jgi:hypothetical protein
MCESTIDTVVLVPFRVFVKAEEKRWVLGMKKLVIPAELWRWHNLNNPVDDEGFEFLASGQSSD